MADGAFAIFFSSPPRSQRDQGKKNPYPRGEGPVGHGCTEPELTDALPGEYLNVFLLV